MSHDEDKILTISLADHTGTAGVVRGVPVSKW